MRIRICIDSCKWYSWIDIPYIRRPPRGHQAQKEISHNHSLLIYWSSWSRFPGLLVLWIQISVYLARISSHCGHVPPSNRFPPRPKNHHVSLPGGGVFPSWDVPDLCKTNENPHVRLKQLQDRPVRPQDSPRLNQDPSRTTQDRPRPPPDRLRSPQDRPNTIPRPPDTAPKRLKKPQSFKTTEL